RRSSWARLYLTFLFTSSVESSSGFHATFLSSILEPTEEPHVPVSTGPVTRAPPWVSVATWLLSRQVSSWVPVATWQLSRTVPTTVSYSLQNYFVFFSVS
ncbi:hypothetical protein ILYODFUR_032272, partial [Ilyodon furcidens]